MSETMENVGEMTGLIIPDWLREKLEQINSGNCRGSSGLGDRVDILVKNYNDMTGDLVGVDCQKCKNRGRIAENRGGYFMTTECECQITRRNIDYIRESGLADLLDLYNFDNYETEYDWQKYVKDKSLDYASDVTGDWLCVLGCVGSGKTHICTAVCGELMKKGHSLKYMLWRDDGVKIKAAVNEEEEYTRLIRPFKDADVLYIDDLFKTKKDASVSAGDINLAFELINYRYYQPNKKTIISSEKSIDELLDIDSAAGSRIYERCKKRGYCLEITQTGEYNFRLK
ncbi:MAG: ATP-binding protein [Oscillospiraceae bacterium]|nr:ATP-binding protein [Oscillospiraceae bacterium]